MKNTKISSNRILSTVFMAALITFALSFESAYAIEGGGGDAPTYNGGGGEDYGLTFGDYSEANSIPVANSIQPGPQKIEQITQAEALNNAVVAFEQAGKTLASILEAFVDTLPANSINVKDFAGSLKLAEAIGKEIAQNPNLKDALIEMQIRTLDLVDAAVKSGLQAEINVLSSPPGPKSGTPGIGDPLSPEMITSELTNHVADLNMSNALKNEIASSDTIVTELTNSIVQKSMSPTNDLQSAFPLLFTAKLVDNTVEYYTLNGYRIYNLSAYIAYEEARRATPPPPQRQVIAQRPIGYPMTARQR
jgi:hypothetical protein